MLFNQKTQLNLTMVSISTKLFSSSFFLLSLVSTVSESNTSNHSEGFKDTISDKPDMAEADINEVILNNLNRTDFESVNIEPINSTCVRINFTLPVWLDHLIGHVKFYYTTDLNISRSQWNIQEFARPYRLFGLRTPNFEYHLSNLSPDTTYFFKIQVVIEIIQSERESEIYKLHLPPIPSMSTTSTTTTTVPPVIMLDVQLNAVPNDYSALNVSWRQFSPQEKKFIDGIQIRFKKAQQDENEWQLTPLLHRDIRSYVLRDLQPGVPYVVDLVLNFNPDISTPKISTKPIVIYMLSEPEVPRENEVTGARYLFGIGIGVVVAIVFLIAIGIIIRNVIVSQFFNKTKQENNPQQRR